MYAYIKGILEEVNKEYITVECGGIGYSIFATSALVNSAKMGQSLKVFLHQVVREDEISLYGFFSKEEKAMFLRLISVSGIGPKLGIGMVSSIGAKNIALALVTGDINSLTKAAGVGKKTAQRLILELRGSIENDELLQGDTPLPGVEDNDIAQEAITAIMALGFSRAEAVRSVGDASDAKTVEDMIRRALLGMGGGK